MNAGDFGPSPARGYVGLTGWRKDDIFSPGWAVNQRASAPHSLPATPTLIMPTMTCVVAEYGWVPGDVLYGCHTGNSAAQVGWSVAADLRRAYVCLGPGNGANPIRIIVKGTGAQDFPTASRWKLGVSAVSPHSFNTFSYTVPNLSVYRTERKRNLPGWWRFGYAGPKPYFIALMAECLAIDGTFSPGDRITVGRCDATSPANSILAYGWDRSGGIACGWDGALRAMPIGGGSPVNLTVANWDFFLMVIG